MWMKWLRQEESKVIRKIPMTASANRFFAQRLSDILSAFIGGYNSVLTENPDIPIVKRELDHRYEEFYRGFAYEGLGMGLGARTLLRPSEKAQFEANIQLYSSQYLFQYYVGLGWWLSLRYGYRPRGYRRFLSLLNPFYGPIVFDGVGFRAGLLHPNRLPHTITKFKRFGPVGERLCYQGLGRSLWFQYEFNILTTLKAVQRLPLIHQEDAVSGVGLAVAYSGFDHLKWIFQLTDFVPIELKPAYCQGLAFGWQARKLQTPQFELAVSSSSPQISAFVFQSQQAVETVLEQLLERGADSDFGDWMDRVRALMTDWYRQQ